MLRYSSIGVVLILVLSIFLPILDMQIFARASKGVDIRSRLSTKTRYSWRLPIEPLHKAPYIYSTPDPEGFEPHYLWFLCRHGTRWPTKGRMAEINTLDKLFKDAMNDRDHPWIKDWKSPVHALEFASGELHSIGWLM